MEQPVISAHCINGRGLVVVVNDPSFKVGDHVIVRGYVTGVERSDVSVSTGLVLSRLTLEKQS